MAGPERGSAMAYDVPQLLQMSQKELDDLFSASESGPISGGEGDGRAIIKPGTPLPPKSRNSFLSLSGRGRFSKAGHLVNRIGVKAFGPEAEFPDAPVYLAFFGDCDGSSGMLLADFAIRAGLPQ
jgi:hypothetical protein